MRQLLNRAARSEAARRRRAAVWAVGLALAALAAVAPLVVLAALWAWISFSADTMGGPTQPDLVDGFTLSAATLGLLALPVLVGRFTWCRLSPHTTPAARSKVAAPSDPA